MGIISIKRDYGVFPSLVRIETTDNLATVNAAGYISSQNENILAINYGEFNWYPADVVLVVASDGSQICSVSGDETSFASIGTGPETGDSYLPLSGGNMTGPITTDPTVFTQIRSGFLYTELTANASLSPVDSNFAFDFTVAGVDLSDVSPGLSGYPDGFVIALKNTSAGSCTFTPFLGDLIDGDASLTLEPQDAVLIVKTSGQWSVISSYVAGGGGAGGGVPVGTDTLATGVNFNVADLNGFTNYTDPAMDGYTFVMNVTATNTGTNPNLQVNGAGYAPIVRNDRLNQGSIYVGDLLFGVPAIFQFSYTFTRWHLVNPISPAFPIVNVSSNESIESGRQYVISAPATYWISGGGGANSPGSRIKVLITSTSDITFNISVGGSTVRFLNNTGTTSLVCNPVSGTAEGHFIELLNTSYNNWVVTNYSGIEADWTLT
jgi:hypothetical protein